MRALALLVVAGCGFTHGASSFQSAGSADGRVADTRSADMVVTAAPVVDATASQSGTTVSSLSWTHTASGSHRLVIVGVSWGLNTTTITSITYGATPMTSIGTKTNTGGGVSVAMYMLVAPPTGAQTVSVTFSSNVGKSAVGGSVSFTGVDQTTPVGPFASATGGNAAIAVAVTSGPTEIVMDTVSADSNPSSLPPGTGQTQLWEIQPDMWGAASTKPGAPSVMMSWTESGSTDPWAEAAVSVRGG